MNTLLLESVFWLGVFTVIYAYLLYPLLIALAARVKPYKSASIQPFSGSISIVLAARNEEGSIERRIVELGSLLSESRYGGEIIIVSDGSTDRTLEIARRHASTTVRVIEITPNVGKAAAISRGCAEARGDIIVFADTRQRWDGQTLNSLLQSFGTSDIGAVSGDLIIESGSGVASGVGMYWRYEKWLRHNEGRYHSTVGVSGSIAAVRRQLFRQIPAGTLIDDVYWPMCVVMQGFRVVHDNRAQAFDKLPENPHDEFRRKVRTLAGNFQLVALLPELVLPWRNPIWLQFVSHKLLRLFVPWLLISVLVSSACLALQSFAFYVFVFVLQLLFYAIGLSTGILSGSRSAGRIAAVIGSFMLLNAAAWLAFWVWISGRAGQTWGKSRYDTGAKS
jgi:cellulose synthase/poly-beta-1,6-N-acetylglucosamine synthase-like glycosyltransferase